MMACTEDHDHEIRQLLSKATTIKQNKKTITLSDSQGKEVLVLTPKSS